MKKRIVKTIGATFVCLFIVYALCAITTAAGMSQPDTWILINFAIVILLSIFFCTFTIIDEIKAFKENDGN
jgi:hypothetical protein